MNLKIKDFERMNLLSNRNMEKLAASVINKSYNAALVNMYEDCVILLDHNEGYFYKADYKFDDKKLQFVFENFERVILEKETVDFNKQVYEFFDGNTDSSALAESYKDNVSEQEKVINELIGETVNNKNFDEVLDISEILENKEEISFKNDKFFKDLKERLISHPLQEVFNFNWEDKVAVSLTESETVKIVSSNAKEKATNLWKNDKFKLAMNEAFTDLVNDPQGGIDEVKELLENYPIIFTLDRAERKTLFGKAIIANKDLRENMNSIIKGVEILFEQNSDIKEMSETYLSEACASKKPKFTAKTPVDTSLSGGDEGKPKNTEETDDEEDTPEEISKDDNAKISEALQKVADKVTDEKLKDKLQKIIDDLADAEDTGMKVESVKEAIAILSL